MSATLGSEIKAQPSPSRTASALAESTQGGLIEKNSNYLDHYQENIRPSKKSSPIGFGEKGIFVSKMMFRRELRLLVVGLKWVDASTNDRSPWFLTGMSTEYNASSS